MRTQQKAAADFKRVEDARRGLTDMAAGWTFEADGTIARLQQRRAASGRKSSTAGKPARKHG